MAKKAAAPPTAEKPKNPRKLPNLSQISGPGFDPLSGFIYDSTIRQLNGPQAFQRFREMADHSSVIGACLFAIEMLIRKVKWKFQPGEGEGEQERAELLNGMIEDMSHSWEDTIAEVLSMLVYGFAYMEIVYKVRKGDQADSRFHSKHSDGLIGWRKWVLVPQETVHRWVFDPEGGIQALEQRPEGTIDLCTIPIEKALLFRTKVNRGNPQGRSLLINAYYPWQFTKRVQEIEGIGLERDLAGLPMALVPAELLSDSADAEQKAFLESIKKLVTGVRRNANEGIIFPMAYDDENNPLWEFKLLATGGMRQFDTNKIIERYERRMAMSLLSDFILMGHERVGSLALSRDKTTLIGRALSGIMNSMASVINRHAIPRLYKLNGWPMDSPSFIVPGDLENADLKTLGTYLQNLASVGLVTPDPDLEAALRDVAGLPPADPEFQLGPEERAQIQGLGQDPNDPNADQNADPSEEGDDGEDEGDDQPEPKKPTPKKGPRKNWSDDGAGSSLRAIIDAAHERRSKRAKAKAKKKGK